MLQNATPLRKSPPWPPNISHEHVSCTALAMRNASFQCPAPAIVFESATKPSRFAHFWQGAQSPAPATENGIWTSKSAPYPSVFSTFDLEMCSAPLRRALFRHVNFQKWSEHGVLCAFWLRNVLRATTACTFSTSQQKWSEHGVFCAFWLRNVLCATTTSKSAPTYWLGNVLRATAARTFSTSQLLKVLRGWGVLYILTWKCASRHNGVQLFIPHLARWLRTRRFSEPTFPPSRATNHWKNTVFRDFPTFSRTWIFFLLRLSLLWSSFFSSLTLPISAFHLPILSEVWLLNILRPGSTTTIATWVVVCLNFDMIEYGLV